MDRLKILITGANGYLGKSLYAALKDKYEVTAITRQDFDLTAVEAMIKFFNGKYFDVILHCAVMGGSRLKEDNWDVMDINLCMYYNLFQCRNHYNKFISFGSGAEIYLGETPYGYSKKVIAKSIINQPNFYNLKIFGLFDENELDTRFIKSNIKRYINNEPIIIHQDKVMDFIYMSDLIKIIEYYINNDGPKELNCNYKDFISLNNIANIINNLDEHKVDIKIENKEQGNMYIGDFNNIEIKFIGLEQGIKEVYNKLKIK